MQVYRFTATARRAGSDASFTDTLLLPAAPSDLVAALEGPSGAVRARGRAAFSAADSFDPDDPLSVRGALSYIWSCAATATGSPCFDG